jgi:hypothetical protein
LQEHDNFSGNGRISSVADSGPPRRAEAWLGFSA